MSESGTTKRDRSTKLGCCDPKAKAVSVEGTFNNWDPAATPLAKGAAGQWGVALDLPPGHHEYKFVIDGESCCEPGCDGGIHDCPKCTPNPFGTMNRVVEVKG
jgi:hypothetical protein